MSETKMENGFGLSKVHCSWRGLIYMLLTYTCAITKFPDKFGRGADGYTTGLSKDLQNPQNSDFRTPRPSFPLAVFSHRIGDGPPTFVGVTERERGKKQ